MSTAAQLSSISAGVDELTRRVGTLAESLDGTERENVAAVLYEVERALAMAGRRLEQLVSDLRR